MTILKKMKTPIFKAEGIPSIDINLYKLSFFVDESIINSITFSDLLLLPNSRINSRLTSVSGWSVRANWEGVLWKDILEFLGQIPDFQYIIFEAYGGTYTTNVYKEDIQQDSWIICHSVDGERLEPSYGAPVRMIIPNLWGYKSCKWLTKITFSSENISGYWETRGYSDRGLIEPGITIDINSGQKRKINGGEVTDF